MYYIFLLITHVFWHSLLCLWSKRIVMSEKLYLTLLFFLYTGLLPLSYIFPIRSIRVGKYIISGVPYLNLLFQFSEIFIKQEYATDTVDPKHIIDAGANIGVATIYFAYYYPNSTITSIEPDPEIFAILKNNIEANHLSDRVTLVNVALGRTKGHVTLYHNGLPGRTTMSIVHEREKSVSEFNVPMDTLSAYIPSEIDILKIDIEGAEHEVFDELTQSYTIDRIKSIVMEYHHIMPLGKSNQSLGYFLEGLEKAGFVYNIDSFHSPLFPHRTQDILIGASKM
ncbi:MAG: FkbM family methyltransferase [Candidatus Roizmanbacteria bacterium]